MGRRLPYLVLLLVVAAVDGAVLVHFKDIPRLGAAGLMLLAVGMPADKPMIAVIYRRLALAIAIWGAVWISLFRLFVTIAPPRTAEGYAVMPMGQFLGAWALSVPMTIGALIWYLRKVKADTKAERGVACGLAIVLAAVALFYGLQRP